MIVCNMINIQLVYVHIYDQVEDADGHEEEEQDVGEQEGRAVELASKKAESIFLYTVKKHDIRS